MDQDLSTYLYEHHTGSQAVYSPWKRVHRVYLPFITHLNVLKQEKYRQSITNKQEIKLLHCECTSCITLQTFYMFIFIHIEREEIVGGGLCVCVIFIVVTEVCLVHSYTCSLKRQEVQKPEETERERLSYSKSKNHITCLLGHISGTSLLNGR